MVNRTRLGGFCKALISSKSLFFKSSKHFTASSNAGNALSKSACALVAISVHSAAFALASSATASTSTCGRERERERERERGRPKDFDGSV